METINEYSNPAIVSGILFLIAGIIMYFFPPKKINYLYGYRTSNSMNSPEKWNYSQKYSSVKLIQTGVFLILFSIFGSMILLEKEIFTIGGLIAIIISVAYVFVRTEKELKNKFSK
jgi:uncharacterized membrane protein